MRIGCIVVVFLMVLSAVGCVEPAPSAAGFQRQRIAGVSYEVAFDAAERAVAERFRVTQRAAETGIIRGESRRGDVPVYPEAANTRPLSDPLGVPRRVRRVADVRMRREGADIDVYCRVRVQENRADTVRMLRREHGVYDQPDDTPIDRDAATSVAQNAVWRDRRRDRGMERSLLASIRELIDKRAAPVDNP